jgi:hypothetical protein
VPDRVDMKFPDTLNYDEHLVGLEYSDEPGTFCGFNYVFSTGKKSNYPSRSECKHWETKVIDGKIRRVVLYGFNDSEIGKVVFFDEFNKVLLSAGSREDSYLGEIVLQEGERLLGIQGQHYDSKTKHTRVKNLLFDVGYLI